MNADSQALEQTHTWELTSILSGKTAVGCRWIYKLKNHANGSIGCYKARFVAKGFTQEYSMDYEETFALIARITTICLVLLVASSK